MKKVLFVCSAGMSTSLLVQKTQQAAAEKNVELEITALGEAEARKCLEEYNAVLLGPQVRFLLSGIQKQLEGKAIKAAVIDSISYGRLDGNAVLNQILEML